MIFTIITEYYGLEAVETMTKRTLVAKNGPAL